AGSVERGGPGPAGGGVPLKVLGLSVGVDLRLSCLAAYLDVSPVDRLLNGRTSPRAVDVYAPASAGQAAYREVRPRGDGSELQEVLVEGARGVVTFGPEQVEEHLRVPARGLAPQVSGLDPLARG